MELQSVPRTTKAHTNHRFGYTTHTSDATIQLCPERLWSLKITLEGSKELQRINSINRGLGEGSFKKKSEELRGSIKQIVIMSYMDLVTADLKQKQKSLSSDCRGSGTGKMWEGRPLCVSKLRWIGKNTQIEKRTDFC